jgi:hypothetical protein
VAKHTPAPWTASHSGYANAPIVIFAGSKAPNYKLRFPLSGVNAIAEVFHDESPAHEEQVANARLIAAAPMLLRVMEQIAEIGKATLEGNPAERLYQVTLWAQKAIALAEADRG